METKTFEENLKRLEEVVRSLENKDISLEEAVKITQLAWNYLRNAMIF